jgi:hypothetical protein
MALYSIIFFILVILFPPREPLVLPVSHCYFESENISALLLKPTKTYDLTQWKKKVYLTNEGYKFV